MIVDRRVFVAGAAIAAFTPALRILPSEAPVPESGATERPAFMISGWSIENGNMDDQVCVKSRSWVEDRLAIGWQQFPPAGCNKVSGLGRLSWYRALEATTSACCAKGTGWPKSERKNVR